VLKYNHVEKEHSEKNFRQTDRTTETHRLTKGRCSSPTNIAYYVSVYQSTV